MRYTVSLMINYCSQLIYIYIFEANSIVNMEVQNWEIDSLMIPKEIKMRYWGLFIFYHMFPYIVPKIIEWSWHFPKNLSVVLFLLAIYLSMFIICLMYFLTCMKLSYYLLDICKWCIWLLLLIIQNYVCLRNTKYYILCCEMLCIFEAILKQLSR